MRLSTALFLVFLLSDICAQSGFPIQVKVAPPQPFPTTREDALKHQSDPFIYLVNTDPNNGFDVMLSGFIEADNGISGAFDPITNPPTESIYLAPGEMRILSFNDLRKLYPSIAESDVFYSGVNRDEVVKSNQIPEGVYTICVRAFDFNSNKPLSAERPQGCSGPLIVSRPEPPFLILPEDGKELDHDYNLIEFRWLPVVGALLPVEYDLEVLRTDGADPFDLFREGRALFYEKSGLLSTVYLLDASNLRLTPGEYAVRITATIDGSSGSIGGEGVSDIHTFVIQETPEDIVITFPSDSEALPYESFSLQWEDFGRVPKSVYFGYIWEDDGRSIEAITDERSLHYFGPIYGVDYNLEPLEMELDQSKDYVVMMHAHKHSRDFFPRKSAAIRFNFDGDNPTVDPPSTNCGGECILALSTDRTPSQNWEENDIVNIGFFQLQLTSIDLAGRVYNGKGRIIADELFERDLDVDLMGLQINDAGKVFQGKAVASAISAIAQFRAGAPSFAEYQGLLFSSGTQGLPYTKGDLLFTKVEFTPTEARADVISALRLSGNRLQSGEALWFSKSDVLINPAGFETAKLSVGLEESVTFADNQNIEYTFKARQTPSENRGGIGGQTPINQQGVEIINLTPIVTPNIFNNRSSTSAKFDCDGVRTIYATGDVLLKRSNGIQFLNATSITGHFFSTFTNWSSAMGTVEFNSKNKNQVLDETYSCTEEHLARKLTVNSLRQFNFGICSAIMDHSFEDSPSDLEPTWTGIYFDKMQVLLPDWIKDIEDKRVKAEIPGMYDGRGFHTNGEAEVPSRIGKLGEWAAIITGVNLEVARGTARNTKLEGSIIFPFAYPIWTQNFDMYFHHVMGRTAVEIDMEDLSGKSFRFIPWKASLTLDASSRLNASLVNNEIVLNTSFDGKLNFERTIDGIPDCDLEDIQVNGLRIGNSSIASNPGIHTTSFDAPNGNYTIAGYRADVTGISTRRHPSGSGVHSILSIDYEFELDNLDLGFLGRTKFEIESSHSVAIGIQNHAFVGAKVRDFSLHIDIPVIKANGTLSFSNSGGKRQYEGVFSAKMCEVLNLESFELQGVFGNTSEYKYWAIAARARLSTKIEFLGNLQLNAFSGGMFTNMKVSRGISNPYIFIPGDEGTFGIVGGIGLEYTVPNLYAGRFDLSATFSGGAVSEIELSGIGSFLYEGSASAPENPRLILDGSILLNFSDQPFIEGDFNYVLNVDEPAFTLQGQSRRGGRSIGFHFSERNWYIRLGTARSPINANLSLKSVIGSEGSFFNASAETYFETGRNMPVNFGLKGIIDGHNKFDQELIFANRFDLDYSYVYGVSGSLGQNNSSCNGINPDNFFGLLHGEMSLSGSLKYYDRCDDWNPLDWDWDGDGDDGCDKWRNLFEVDAGISGKIYGTGPTGANLTASFGFTLVKRHDFSKNLQLGTVCN